MLRIVAFFFLSVPVLAQNEQGPQGVNCAFLRINSSETIPDELYAVSAKDQIRERIILSENANATKVNLLPSAGSLLFYKSKDEELDKSPVLAVKLEPGMKEVLIMTLPPSKEGGVINTIVFDVGPNSFKEGSSSVLNLATQDVRFTIGEHNVLLKSGKKTVVPKPGKLDKFNRTEVMFQFQLNDSWKTVYKSMLNFPDERRRLFVTYVDTNTGRPRARIFTL